MRALLGSIILLMVLVLGVREGCVAIRGVTIERADLYPYQVTVLTVPLENRCVGSRNVTVEANPSGRFHVLDGPPVDLELDKARNVTFAFYPLSSVSGTTHIPVVALDLTEDDAMMTGAKADLYVANPLRQWRYIMAAVFLAAGYAGRRRLARQIEPSPVPLVLGSWFVYRSYLMITRNDMVENLLAAEGAVPLDTVNYLELLMLGLVLIVLGRTIVSVFRREPLPLLLAVFIFVQLFPARMYLPDGVMAAWASRSPMPLRGLLLLLLAPPALVLEEVFRLYPFHGMSAVYPLALALPITVLYWRHVVRYVRRGVEREDGGRAWLLAFLDLDAGADEDGADGGDDAHQDLTFA